MIQFFIENQEVILPDNFSFTQRDENPLITNNGEFTLDITISLRNGKNAKAAKYINRINKIDIDKSYKSLMIDDGKYKHGTSIIQNHTNSEMTFQFVAGNSELNYLSQNDKKIWELDWGTELPIDYARALSTISNVGYSEPQSGDNLLRNNSYALTNWYSPTGQISFSVSSQKESIIATSPNARAQNKLGLKFILGKTYTFSFYTLGLHSFTATILGNVSKLFTPNSMSNPIRCTFTFTCTSNDQSDSLYIDVPTPGSELLLYNFKLEYGDTATDYTSNTVYFNSFVCAPVKIGGTIYNNFLLNENTLVVPNQITGIERLIMQPYLLYYLNKLPSLLGFNSGDNVLNSDERVLITYMLNAVDSLDYSDALPDMTITEFIEAIETTYNVWFIVNSVTNTMSIVRTKTQFENKKTVRLLNVLDEFTREIDTDENSFRFGYSKVQYELSDDLYFKYNALSEEIIKKCTIIEFENKSSISSYILSHDTPDQFIIYRDISTDEDYFYGRPTNQDFCSIKIAEDKYITLINKYKGVGESTKNILSLKVVPAKMQGDYRDVMWYLVSGQEKHSKFQYQLPVSSNTFQNIIITDGFMKSVEDGIKTTQRLSVIEVALFSGVLQTSTYLWWAAVPVPGRLNIQYPFSHTDYWPDFWVMDDISDRFDRFVDWYNTYYSPFVQTTMRLSGPKGLVENYKLENLIDLGKKYEFKMPDSINLLSENLFEYKNQKYIPICFERTKSKKKGMVTGTFYRML